MQVRVSDTGSGIAARELPFVFDRFYRGSSNARAIGGAGPGLAIMRRIVELHSIDNDRLIVVDPLATFAAGCLQG